MQIDKYDKLKERIVEQDFESRNKNLKNWLFTVSFLANIGSIFFAYFLVYPAFLKAVGTNLISGQFANIFAIIFTIIILAIFEIIKRIVVGNLSLDLIKTKWNFAKREVIWWSILTLSIIISSAYLSIDGAMNFAQTTKHQNILIENSIKTQADSLTNVYNQRKTVLINDNNKLRDSNTGLRKKIDQTPLTYRTIRSELQNVINQNLDVIQSNDNKMDGLDKELNSKIETIKKDQTTIINNNLRNNVGTIILFTFMASFIEFLIIFGIWYKELYDVKCLQLNEPKLEPIRLKKKRYITLLKFIYKEGLVGRDEQVMPGLKLKQMVKEKSNLLNPDKIIDEFFNDMDHLNIFKVIGKKRFTTVSYNEAIKKIQDFDDTLRLLENLE